MIWLKHDSQTFGLNIESMKLILAEIEKTFRGEGFMEVDQIMTSLRCPLGMLGK